MTSKIEHIHGRSVLQPLGGRKMNREPLVLEVVIAKHCQQCRESLRVVEALEKEFPTLDVRVVDLDTPDAVKPDAVFAVPSFVLNGRVVSLGNPKAQEISEMIRDILQTQEEIG
jgi:predicted thioredoxin/glutaredoxin